MIAGLTNHLWQSTLFVIAAAIVAFALRKNGAAVRHRIWLAASLKFFLPFSLLMSLGSVLPWPASIATRGGVSPAPALSVAVDQIAQPFSDDVLVGSTTATTPKTTNWASMILIGTWASGLAIVGLMRLRGWRRIRSAVRGSVPVELATEHVSPDLKVRATTALLEPGVVGLWRPVLLVPAGIERQLTRAQLDAVLAHEFCHVQRRDNLTSAIHMVVEAVFWFHPLVWFVGARLVEERERACDEYVLRVCGEPATYAESILSVCKLYVESPVACVSGVSGADLKRRIAAIVSNRVGVQLNIARRIVLITAAALAVLLPLAAGALVAPLRATASSAGQNPALTAGAGFEVVSIKPCDPNSPPTIGGTPGRRGYPAWVPQTSPGHVVWTCATLAQLIDQAYVDREHPLLNVAASTRTDSLQGKRVRGGPSWVDTEKFAIEAKIPADASQGAGGNSPQVLTTLPPSIGQSLRAMLEDRFQLKVHRATEQQDMYALTIAKAGLNKERMQETKPGDCVTSAEYFAADPATQRNLRICGRYEVTTTSWIFSGNSLRQLSQALSSMMDLYVQDKSGVDGTFNFVVDFSAVSDALLGDDRFIDAVSRLGLKLDRTKGPAEYVQIDSAQKPKPNFAVVGSALPQLGMQTKFDVVSIKPCNGTAPAGTGRSAAPWNAQISPGYAHWDCVQLIELIDQAYAGGGNLFFAGAGNQLLNMNQPDPLRQRAFGPKRVRGGPSWVENEKFTIEVRLSDSRVRTRDENLAYMRAALPASMRAMLEDRFQLKVHRASEEQPMYALTVAKSGLDKNKVREVAAENCVAVTQLTSRDNLADQPPVCSGGNTTFPAGNRRSVYSGTTFALFTVGLSRLMDRFVLDRTGLAGTYAFALEFAPDSTTPGAGPAPPPAGFAGRPAAERPPGDGPTIFKALDTLGLKLEATKGLAEYIQIDSVQKPRPN
jgi:uncharacterized protein (TIGR03435 family)